MGNASSNNTNTAALSGAATLVISGVLFTFLPEYAMEIIVATIAGVSIANYSTTTNISNTLNMLSDTRPHNGTITGKEPPPAGNSNKLIIKDNATGLFYDCYNHPNHNNFNVGDRVSFYISGSNATSVSLI